MKVKEDAVVEELPLDDERLPEAKKYNRHVQIALNHMRKRMDQLLIKQAALTVEIDDLAQAIEALE